MRMVDICVEYIMLRQCATPTIECIIIFYLCFKKIYSFIVPIFHFSSFSVRVITELYHGGIIDTRRNCFEAPTE